MRHEDLWRALDTLAAERGLTPSGLARAAGLDPTSFNRSRRFAPDGRPRWPGTETISLVLAATGVTLEGFVALVGGARTLAQRRGRDDHAAMPVAALHDEGIAGEFDARGAPHGDGWELREAPFAVEDPGAYGLTIETEALAPALVRGDVAIVSPGSTIEAGDRVVAPLADGVAVVRLIGTGQGRARFATLLGAPLDEVVRADLGWLHRVAWTGH